MKRGINAYTLGLATLRLAVVLATLRVTTPPPLQAAIVYSNDFNAGSLSLNGYTIGGDAGAYSVGVANGQLEVDTTVGQYIDSVGYAAISNSAFAAPYSSTLKHNAGLVTWAFNVSNQDGQYNNSFVFGLATSTPNPLNGLTSGYEFWGGGGVGNTMYLQRLGYGVPIVVQVPNGSGLDTLPTKGSLRITYQPTNDLWSIYGQFGSSYVDPTTVTNLLGSGVDSYWTSTPLPFTSLGGDTTGSDFFDNVSVSVIPEPATWCLVMLGAITILGSRHLGRRSL